MAVDFCFSRLILGANKVLRIALGRSEADEIKDGIHQASNVSNLSCVLEFCFLSWTEQS